MKLLFSNKKFNLNYSSLDEYECGISLKGNEVKSIIKSNASIDESFVIINKQEAFLLNMYVAPYEFNKVDDKFSPTRKRKLLLHKHEILKISYRLKKEHLTLIPTQVYIHNNVIKLKLCLAKSKNKKDKRVDLKVRDINREIKKY